MACSMSRCAYQTSSNDCCANAAHRRAVALGRRQHDLAAVLGREPVVPPGHGEAGRQPLDVPLERPGQRLVEVVDVEDQAPLRGGERAEVGQVRVPAQLHPQPRRRRGGQIRRHRQRRAAVERERRHQHPPVPDRHQLRHPASAPAPTAARPDRATRPARTPHATPTGPPPGHPSPEPPDPPDSTAPHRSARAPDRRRRTTLAVTVMPPSEPQRLDTATSCTTTTRLVLNQTSTPPRPSHPPARDEQDCSDTEHPAQRRLPGSSR